MKSSETSKERSDRAYPIVIILYGRLRGGRTDLCTHASQDSRVQTKKAALSSIYAGQSCATLRNKTKEGKNIANLISSVPEHSIQLISVQLAPYRAQKEVLSYYEKKKKSVFMLTNRFFPAT